MRRVRIPNAQILWQKHVTRVLNVLCRALQKLCEEENLPLREDKVDRILCIKARDVYFSLDAKDRPQSFNLIPKAEHFPEEVLDNDKEWVRKRPDFKWRMQDDFASSPESLVKDFDIESKRLGRPTSRNWVLTEQYVVNGIIRFLSDTHRYGNNVSDGAIIGYVQNWDIKEILADINKHIRNQKCYKSPTLRAPKNKKAVIQMRQTLKRLEIGPSHFLLHHLWTSVLR